MNERDFYSKTKARELTGAYLLYGVEELTKQDAVQRVKALADETFSSLNVSTLRLPTAAQLLDTASQYPFADTIRVITVTDWDDKELEPIVDKLLHLPAETVLLMVQRGAAKKASSLYKRLEPADRLVEFAALTQDRAVSMLLRDAALMGVLLSKQTARRLTEMVGCDAYRLRNEFSKAAGYVGQGCEVTPEVLRRCCTPQEEYDVFNMLDCFMSGNRAGGLRLLYSLRSGGDRNALGTAAFIEGRIKLLLTARQLLDAKTPRQEAIRRMGGNPKAAEIALKKAAKLSGEQLERTLIAFSQVDSRLKQGLGDEDNGLFLAIAECF